jgi:hypothetical protein
MPIVHMISNRETVFPEGTICHVEFRDGKVWNPWQNSDLARDLPTLTYQTHHGLCIAEYEQNGRDDSDFFMRVWNPVEKKIETLMFATTRGWSYPCFGSSADATPETMAAVNAHVAYHTRRTDILNRRSRLHAGFRMAKAMGITVAQFNRLQDAYGSFIRNENFDRLYKLLTTKKFRSGFRAKCATQIREWLTDANPKYRTPISPRQFACI